MEMWNISNNDPTKEQITAEGYQMSLQRNEKIPHPKMVLSWTLTKTVY